MIQSLIIIISGPPCTGKTTLGKKIAEKFSLPFISKDDIKESLFDDLGWSDREWSKKLGMASYSILYYTVESLLQSNTSFIIESNFKPEFENKKFVVLRKKYNFKSLQILCKTEGKILFERFKKRSESSDRHLGHNDSKNYDEFKDILLKGKLEPLEISGDIMEIDTTNFAKINYKKIFKEIEKEVI
ncbi:MAG: AAA family ATPase [Parcubacteria group bacterium]|nr:AAA family ATPase [Parcubacteria group bacterium]